MDVAWMLGVESPAQDWELRISMRSFWTHYHAQGTPWIIGFIPAWIDRQKVRCLEWPDPYKRCKDANLLHKALRLALEPGISDPFILCSDDHILLKPSLPNDFRLWHSGEILREPVAGLTFWQRRLVSTGKRLREAGYPALNFDGHIPYPLRKEWIRDALRFDFPTRPGMCVFSTIINCGREPGEPIDAGRVRAWLGGTEITDRAVDSKLAKNKFACLNNGSLSNPYVVAKMEEMFPHPAPWELDGLERSRAVPAANETVLYPRLFGMPAQPCEGEEDYDSADSQGFDSLLCAHQDRMQNV